MNSFSLTRLSNLAVVIFAQRLVAVDRTAVVAVILECLLEEQNRRTRKALGFEAGSPIEIGIPPSLTRQDLELGSAMMLREALVSWGAAIDLEAKRTEAADLRELGSLCTAIAQEFQNRALRLRAVNAAEALNRGSVLPVGDASDLKN